VSIWIVLISSSPLSHLLLIHSLTTSTIYSWSVHQPPQPSTPDPFTNHLNHLLLIRLVTTSTIYSWSIHTGRCRQTNDIVRKTSDEWYMIWILHVSMTRSDTNGMISLLHSPKEPCNKCTAHLKVILQCNISCKIVLSSCAGEYLQEASSLINWQIPIHTMHDFQAAGDHAWYSNNWCGVRRNNNISCKNVSEAIDTTLYIQCP